MAIARKIAAALAAACLGAPGMALATPVTGGALGPSDSESLLVLSSDGVKNGGTLQGLTTITLDVDTEKAISLPEGNVYISALQIHGRPFRSYYLADLQAANGNKAKNAAKIREFWYDQNFTGAAAYVKVGPQRIDKEFVVSTGSSLFINTVVGWPLVPSAELYGGGPAYPLASPGVRLRVVPGQDVTLLGGVFNDNPGRGNFRDNAQQLDAKGARFNPKTGALFIAELQYAFNPGGVPGTYKAGFWYDSGRFAGQYFSEAGLSLADHGSHGRPRQHHGNYSIYGVVDQVLWQSAVTQARRLSSFVRIMGAPDSRNQVGFGVNGGLTLTAPLPGRDADSVGLDVGLGHVSGRAAALDRAFGGSARGTEWLLELTYQAQVTSRLVVQPDLQYVFNPGGGVADPVDPHRVLGNEFIAGLRAVVAF